MYGVVTLISNFGSPLLKNNQIARSGWELMVDSTCRAFGSHLHVFCFNHHKDELWKKSAPPNYLNIKIEHQECDTPEVLFSRKFIHSL
jgi:hypothetical protein